MTRTLAPFALALLLAACGQPATEDASETVVETPAIETASQSEPVAEAEPAMQLSIEEAYIMAPLKGRDVAAGYFTVTNSGGDASLVSAASSVAATVELHTHTMDEGVMRMREVEAIDLPSGETVTFEPGGLHLMMFGFAREDGQVEAPVTLTFASGDTLDVTLPIRERE